MARAKSVVLSKAEKKAVIVDLKGQIKAAKDAGKAIATRRKDADKALATVAKSHAAAVKGHDKAAAANGKSLTSLEAQLASLTA